MNLLSLCLFLVNSGFRRSLLRALTALVLFWAVTFGTVLPAYARSTGTRGDPRQFAITRRDDAFLEELSRREFRYFIEQSNAETGLVLDRAHTDGSPHDEAHRRTASIAATGFGLTALCLGAARGWIAPAEAHGRVLSALRFMAERAPVEHGWYYHWMDVETGARTWNSEVSSIDTALLLAGVLAVRGYFDKDADIGRLATLIYDRVDFQWMLNGDPLILSHGWKPEIGFLKARWSAFSEDTILYLLAIGSPTHPIPPAAWYAWRRELITFAGYTYVFGAPPLFIHQYPQAWADFRNRRESAGLHTDYFANSVKATRAHRLFCLSLSKEFPGYTRNVWGITASDSAKGYVAWGGPPRDRAIDGTVVPCAPGGSLMFTPDITIPALRVMRDKYGDRIYGRYGFADSFNPNNGWVDGDVIGINEGIMLLSAENLRTGNVWRWFMRNTEMTRAMQLAGLRLTGRNVIRRAARRRRRPWAQSVREASQLSVARFDSRTLNL